MEYVWGFLRCLVDVAGPPDQPAFLAPVSPAGLELAARVRGGEQGHLKRALGTLDPLLRGAAGHEERRQENDRACAVEQRCTLLRFAQVAY